MCIPLPIYLHKLDFSSGFHPWTAKRCPYYLSVLEPPIGQFVSIRGKKGGLMVGRIDGRKDRWPDRTHFRLFTQRYRAKHQGTGLVIAMKSSKEQRSWSISPISPISSFSPFLFVSRWRTDTKIWILWSLSFRKSSGSAILKESRYKSSLACPHPNRTGSASICQIKNPLNTKSRSDGSI